MESNSPTVVASFHLVHYHRLTPAPPKRLGQTEVGVRFWRPLNVGGDFQKFRTNPSRWALYRKLKPDFWRWAFFGIWEHEDALARFLERSPVARSWSDGAEEALHLWLKPTRTRGRWSAMRALEGTEQQGLPKAPAAFITRLDLSIRGTLTMWLTAAPGILACVPDRDALQLAIPLVDRPYAQPMTFTIWTSLDRALAFAYQDGGHSKAVERMERTTPALSEQGFSSAGFYPYRSVGSWEGHDPLAEATAAAVIR